MLEPLGEGWLLRLRRSGLRPPPRLDLPFLGVDRAAARLDGRTVRLTLRHAELLTLLALYPGGRTADQLATDLYGEAGQPASVRVEMHRLRVALGATMIRTQPYRLQASIGADLLDVATALRTGRVRDAAELYRGPLLPESEAPGVRDEREQLAVAVRGAVLRSGDVTALWALAQATDGTDDLELTDRLPRALPHTDSRRTLLAGLDRRGRAHVRVGPDAGSATSKTLASVPLASRP